jgi:hypothetical protein
VASIAGYLPGPGHLSTRIGLQSLAFWQVIARESVTESLNLPAQPPPSVTIEAWRYRVRPAVDAIRGLDGQPYPNSRRWPTADDVAAALLIEGR